MKNDHIFRQLRDKFLFPISERLDALQRLQHQENELIATFISENRNSSPDYKELSKKHLTALIEQRWKIIDSFDSIRFSNYEFMCRICDGKINTNKAKQFRTECMFKGGTILRFECPHCGCIIGPLKMLELDKVTFDLDYSQHYSIYSEGDTTEYEKRTFYQMDPQKNKCYLNYGCGTWSKALEELSIEGYDVFGYEPFSYKGDNAHIITSIEVLSNMRFDGIFSHNVLEHLTNPIDSFKIFIHLLKEENSIMVHSTACYEYLYEFTRFHLYFFTGNSLQKICDRTGLKLYGKISDEINNEKYISYKFKKM